MTEVFDVIYKLFTLDSSVMDLFANIIWGLLYLIQEGFLTLIEAIVGAIDVGSHVTSIAAQWGVLPDVMVYLINAVGIPQALSVIGWAYGIRFILNLIPATFTRV